MVQIAGKAFTQVTSLNIIDEFRIRGVLVQPGGGDDIVTVSSEYNQELDDDVIIGTGTFNINLIAVSTAIKRVTIRSNGASTLTLIPDGSDTTEITTVSANTSVTLAPNDSDSEWFAL